MHQIQERQTVKPRLTSNYLRKKRLKTLVCWSAHVLGTNLSIEERSNESEHDDLDSANLRTNRLLEILCLPDGHYLTKYKALGKSLGRDMSAMIDGMKALMS